MSAPDTNIEKQQKRQYGPLWGIAAVLVFVAIGAVAIPAIADEVSENTGTIAPDQVEASQ